MTEEAKAPEVEEEVSVRDQKEDNLRKIEALDRAHSKAEAEEEKDLLLDFDRSRTEYLEKVSGARFKVKFEGVSHYVPAQASSKFTFFYLRNCLSEQGAAKVLTIPDEFMAEFMTMMFGEELAGKIMDSNETPLSYVLSVMIPAVLRVWGLNPDPDEAGKETDDEGKN